MRRVVLLLLCLTLPVHAQVVPTPSHPVPLQPGMAPLTLGWRTHIGDNPVWAKTGFDDSTWPTISLAAPNDFAGWRWYRLRADFPARRPTLALLVTGGRGTYEVYVNGERLSGPKLHSPLAVTYPGPRVVPLPAGSGPIEIALRTHIPATSMFLADRGAFRVAVGTDTAIHNAYSTQQGARIDEVLFSVCVQGLQLLAGFALLTLFWYERDHREYLWLGIYLLTYGEAALGYELAMWGFVPFSINWFFSELTFYIGTIAQIEFTFSFVGQRVNRPWRMYESILLIPTLLFLVPAWLGFLSRGVFNVGEILVIAPATIGLPVLLLLWYRRGNREAGWLIFPSILPMIAVLLGDLGIADGYLHWSRLAVFSYAIRVGVLSLWPHDLTQALFLLAIGIVMFFRFTRVSREQARAAAELEAAQRVQVLLLRVAPSAQSGLRFESVYRPAQEVGGDFFHNVQIGDSTRVVVGDVSGKGLGAAMLVSALVGALDALRCTAPAEVLHVLNDLLLSRQRDGFATCLCATVAAEGGVTLANAGHLPPYRNGEELPLPPALPLGVSSDAEYAETTVQLTPGDSLTFLSDGVVEARNSSGELFGFDRTRAISIQSAEAIARAATTHGQQDDITVLTLQFAPAEAVHA
jgi:phosphoserine phosphatase RsbU/P